MTQKVRTLVLRTAGTNCDRETVFAFEYMGSDVSRVHVNRLFSGEVSLSDFHILALPGGFTYGDDIAAGRILANELRMKLGDELKTFIDDGKLIIGICNGFQILVKAGLLPGGDGSTDDPDDSHQQSTLMTNDSGKFEDRWTYLSVSGQCVWTEGLEPVVYFPVAHGEGKFVTRTPGILSQLQSRNQIVFRYCTENGGVPQYPDNPNGSTDNIAGICDPTGRILGLMPHPERHFLFTQHPRWTRADEVETLGDGAEIFKNGVNYIQRTLLNGKKNYVQI